MHGWNDPIDHEGQSLRPVPPTEEPPYRPARQSPYGSGGYPAHPPVEHRDYQSYGSTAYSGLPGPDGHGHPVTPHDNHRPGYLDGGATGTDPYGVTHTEPASTEARHRDSRRFSHPVLAACATAVAALAVMVGAGATLMPTGNERQPVVADGAAGGQPGTWPGPVETTEPTPGTAGTPSATATPSPSPTRTAKPSPTATRSTAPSRSIKRTTSPPRTTAPAGNQGTSSVEQQVVTLVNQERAKAGCGAVSVNANLATAAQLHSDDQAAHQKMSHDGSDGSDFVQRAKRAGYQYPIGENVAMGYETAAAVMQGWMNSSGHRANILNCNAKAIGVGVATGGGRLYWTQVFGSRA